MSAADLVSTLSTARRAVQLYPESHPSHAEAVGALVAAVRDCAAAGPFVLNLHQGRLYDGSQVIAGEHAASAALAASLEKHRVESLTFDVSFSERDAAQLAEALNMRPAPSLRLEEELGSRGVTSVVVAALVDEEDEEQEERDRRREKDRALYRQLVSALRNLHAQAAGGGSPNLEHAGSMVDDIMSRLTEDESAVLGMAVMTGRDESSLFHGINVMIYALAIGLTLGLPDEGLMALGMAALLHDVGKAPFDMSDPQQATAAQALHPQVGAEILSRLGEEDRTPMLVAYEHHMGVDGTGYPERSADYIGHPYSRMVSIADRYDNLTKRGDGGDPLTPDRAVVRVLQEAGHSLDQFFARIFVKALGVFPIGCVVRLSDQSVGVVKAKTDDLLTPVVRVVYDPAGTEQEDMLLVDLREDTRTIVEVLEPDALALDVAERL